MSASTLTVKSDRPRSSVAWGGSPPAETSLTASGTWTKRGAGESMTPRELYEALEHLRRTANTSSASDGDQMTVFASDAAHEAVRELEAMGLPIEPRRSYFWAPRSDRL